MISDEAIQRTATRRGCFPKIMRIIGFSDDDPPAIPILMTFAAFGCKTLQIVADPAW